MLNEIVPDPPFPPVAATSHVADAAALPAIVPERRRAPRLPFAPWRFMMLASIAISIFLVAPAAVANPGFNGADLALLICMAGYVAVFAIPGKDL